MKLIFGSALLLFIFACNTGNKEENLSMAGIYKMTSQSFKTDSLDTTITSQLQLKIYTDGYMIYANVNPSDSVNGFGIGTYTAGIDTVTENIFYTSFDSSANDSTRTYHLFIEKLPGGYKQVISDIQMGGQPATLTETYDTVARAASSPIDGAWKETANYHINGNDTTSGNIIQYKVYYDGYVVWGDTFTDSANVKHTAMGYGTFTMSGDNKVTENMEASNFSAVTGHTFNIDIEMMGPDGFKQTITNADGSKNVEVYERLKM